MASLTFPVVALLALAPGFSESYSMSADPCKVMSQIKDNFKDQGLTETQLEDKVVRVLCYLEKGGIKTEHLSGRDKRSLDECSTGVGVDQKKFRCEPLGGAVSTAPFVSFIITLEDKLDGANNDERDVDWQEFEPDARNIEAILDEVEETNCDTTRLKAFITHCNS